MTTTLPTGSASGTPDNDHTYLVIGRMEAHITDWVRGQQPAGVHGCVSIHEHHSHTKIFVHGLNPDRYPEHNADDLVADTQIYASVEGTHHILEVSRATKLLALQAVNGILAFPADTGATLRLVNHNDGAS